jgi:hypothetical protein
MAAKHFAVLSPNSRAQRRKMASWFEGLSILRNWKAENKLLWLVPFGTSGKGIGVDVQVRRVFPSHVTFVFKLSGETMDMAIAGAEVEVTDQSPLEEVPTGQFTRFLRISRPDGSIAVIGEYSDCPDNSAPVA